MLTEKRKLNQICCPVETGEDIKRRQKIKKQNSSNSSKEEAEATPTKNQCNEQKTATNWLGSTVSIIT